MSEKIRTGNDIQIDWSLVDEEGQPYILEGRDIAVEVIVAEKKRVRIKDFTVGGNTVHFTYYGKDQKYTGRCDLKYIENDGEVNMVTFDTKDAFTMVPHSWLAVDDGETPEAIQLEFVTVVSNLMSKVGPPGTPAGFGEVTAEVDENIGGTPSVDVTTSGPNTAKNFHFSFHNLKGVPGRDAQVTSESVIEALGYTPVSKDVSDLTNYYDKDAVDDLISHAGPAGFSVDGTKLIIESSTARVEGSKLIL